MFWWVGVKKIAPRTSFLISCPQIASCKLQSIRFHFDLSSCVLASCITSASKENTLMRLKLQEQSCQYLPLVDSLEVFHFCCFETSSSCWGGLTGFQAFGIRMWFAFDGVSHPLLQNRSGGDTYRSWWLHRRVQVYNWTWWVAHLLVLLCAVLIVPLMYSSSNPHCVLSSRCSPIQEEGSLTQEEGSLIQEEGSLIQGESNPIQEEGSLIQEGVCFTVSISLQFSRPEIQMHLVFPEIHS